MCSATRQNLSREGQSTKQPDYYFLSIHRRRPRLQGSRGNALPQNKRDKLNPDKARSTLDVQRQLAAEKAVSADAAPRGRREPRPAAPAAAAAAAAGNQKAARAAQAAGAGEGPPAAQAPALQLAPRLKLGERPEAEGPFPGSFFPGNFHV